MEQRAQEVLQRAHLSVTRNKIVKLKCNVMIKVHIDTWIRSTEERQPATPISSLFSLCELLLSVHDSLFSAGLQDAFMNVVPLAEINSM